MGISENIIKLREILEKMIAEMSDEEIKNMPWTTFVSGIVEPELIEYLKERRIYVNEPIDTEEDM